MTKHALKKKVFSNVAGFSVDVAKVFLLFAEPVEPLIAATESLIPDLEAAEPAPPPPGRCTISPNLMFHS